MKTQYTECNECFYLFLDEVQINNEIEIAYRCGRPVGIESAKRFSVGGIDHDIIIILKKSASNIEKDDDTIVAPDWCEGFKQDLD